MDDSVLTFAAGKHHTRLPPRRGHPSEKSIRDRF